MKTVGIIGGLGPATTAEFYLEIISGCLKKNQIKRPPILIWNVPLLLQIEKELITQDKGEKRYLPYLIESAQILERGGADFLVMPCNTLHIFIEEIRQSVSIPVLSIIEETVEVLKAEKLRNVGILSTSATISKNLFQDKKIGIQVLPPNKIQQHELDEVIHKLVMGDLDESNELTCNSMIQEMLKQGVEAIILACTDLQLIIKDRQDVVVLDTMKILAEATVKRIIM